MRDFHFSESGTAISAHGARMFSARVESRAWSASGLSVYHSLTPRCDKCQFANRYGTTPCQVKIAERQKKTMTGPVFLQDHDAPVRFRNVWLRPSTTKPFVYAITRTNPSVNRNWAPPGRVPFTSARLRSVAWASSRSSDRASCHRFRNRSIRPEYVRAGRSCAPNE